MGMREKVAKAIWDARERGFPAHTRMTWENGTETARVATMLLADAALDALAEPTAGMVRRGGLEKDTDGFTAVGGFSRNIFRAMIAAAREGK